MNLLKMRLSIRKWAKHIINRFGKEIANKFAISNTRCPCAFIHRACGICLHQTRTTHYSLDGCYHAIKYERISVKRKIKIKNKIKRLTRK